MKNELGKLPPQNIEAERAVLGACMIESGVYAKAARLIKAPGYFYKTAHQYIWRAFQSLALKKEPIDILTVTEEIRKFGNGILEEVGNAQYITSLTSFVNSGLNIEAHAAFVVEAYVKREIISASSNLLAKAYDEVQDPLEILSESLQRLQKVGKSLQTGRQTILSDVVVQVINEVDKSITSKKKLVETLTYGDPNIDEVIGGIRRGHPDLIILGGRPSMGKSLVSAIMLKRNAMAGFPGGLITTEMPAVQYVKRMMIGEAGGTLSLWELENTFVSTNQFRALTVGSGPLMELKRCPIYDEGGLDIEMVEVLASIWKEEYGIEFLVIDFLQHLRSSRGKNRNEEMGHISRALKSVAKKLSMPIVALSSLNRNSEHRGGDRRPTMADLRESGDIESDADVVWLLHRPGYYDKSDPMIELDIEHIFAKNRNGKTATVESKLDLKTARVPSSFTPIENTFIGNPTQAPF